MPLVLNEEQRLLQDTAREFLASHAPVRALRKLRDARDPLGYLDRVGHMQSVDQVAALEIARKRGKLAPGAILVLAAAGTGYTWSAVALRTRR